MRSSSEENGPYLKGLGYAAYSLSEQRLMDLQVWRDLKAAMERTKETFSA